MSEVKKCPKCGEEMALGESVAGRWGFRFRKPGDWVGDRIIPYCRKKCSYIEFYKEIKCEKEQGFLCADL